VRSPVSSVGGGGDVVGVVDAAPVLVGALGFAPHLPSGVLAGGTN